MAPLGIRLDQTGGTSCVLPGEEGASPHSFLLLRASQAHQHRRPQFADEETEAERLIGPQVSPTRPGTCPPGDSAQQPGFRQPGGRPQDRLPGSEDVSGNRTGAGGPHWSEKP